MTLVEVCLEDAGGAAVAAAAGADAIEVCAGLAEGGTTPTPGFVRHCVKAAPGLEHRVLVRARPGDFVHSAASGLGLLADLGVRRVLTSGGAGPALGHLDLLADLVRRGGEDVRIAVGGGVRPGNVARIVAATGAREVHLRAPGTVPSAGVSAGYDDGTRSVTSSAVLAEVMAALGR